jgi:hypothetical protein
VAKDRILGDINPTDQPSGRGTEESSGHEPEEREHVGARDVTEGTTGGTGTKTGGTRNYRTGSGVTGTDIGNRPE